MQVLTTARSTPSRGAPCRPSRRAEPHPPRPAQVRGRAVSVSRTRTRRRGQQQQQQQRRLRRRPVQQHTRRARTSRDAERNSPSQGQLVFRPSRRGRAPYRHDAQQPSHCHSEIGRRTGRRAAPVRGGGLGHSEIGRRTGRRAAPVRGGGLGDASGELWKCACESAAALRALKRARRRGRRAGTCGVPQPSSPCPTASSLARAP